MTVMSDKWIAEQAFHNGLVSPFFKPSRSTLEHDPRQKCPSYGLSSYGYDVRLGHDFKAFKRKGVEPEGAFNYGTLRQSVPMSDRYYMVERRGNWEAVDVPYAASGLVIDPCNFDPDCMFSMENVDRIIIPPHGFVLGVTMERIVMPRNMLVTCMGKSTVARAASIVIVTPLEPEWEGHITLEITNSSDNDLVLTAGMGITQLVWQPGDQECETSYADRAGKYQDQGAVAVAVR